MRGELPPNALEVLRTYVQQDAFFSSLGLEVEAFDLGEVRVKLPYDERFANPGDPAPLQGGVIATLIDATGAMALRPALEDPVVGTTATVTLSVNYLRPAIGEVDATTEVVHAGQTVGYTSTVCEGATPDGSEIVATGQASFRLLG